jgi:hypothetical protein
MSTEKIDVLSDEFLEKVNAEHHRVLLSVLSSVDTPNPEIPVEVIIATALQRSRDLVAGYFALIKQRNLTSASAVIRMQLDSVMRVNACFLVDDPLKIWGALKSGKSWIKVKDRDGKELTDNYMSKKLSEKFPWAASLYEKMCAYVHLSTGHLKAATEGEEFLGMRIFHGAPGMRATDDDLIENIKTFVDVTEALLIICESYVGKKSGRA